MNFAFLLALHYLCNMAGIYVHIPFCKSRCKYCDFYSTTGGEERNNQNNQRIQKTPNNPDIPSKQKTYVEAICREMEQRKDFLQSESVKTLYFGGGTPSQLFPALLERIIRKAEQTFDFNTLDELTIEANPDDLSQEWIDELKDALPQYALRISMGIQTFDDTLLRLLGRRHTAQEAIDAVHRLQDRRITEISIDLMYGLPRDGKHKKDYLEVWKEDLEQTVRLGVPHISAYHLSFEEGTPLYFMRERGEVHEVDEEESLTCFRLLRQTLLEAGYRHYEISNFALPGHEARHNSSYWNGIPYLGLGPGAHSYDGTRRTWNHPNLEGYLRGINGSEMDIISSGETLSDEERYNEYIMTRLRTAQGISLQEIRNLFGEEQESYCRARAQTYLKNHRLYERADGRWALTEEGIFVSDAIIVDLFC